MRSFVSHCTKKDCTNPLLLSISLCIVSGTLFIVLGGLWPISYGWSRKRRRNFTMLGFLFRVWFLLFFCVTVALGIELYEHRDPFLDFWASESCDGNEQFDPESNDQCGRNITFVCKSRIESCIISDEIKYTVYVPMVTTASMLVVILIFVFLSSFCLCCCRKRLGHVF